MRLFERTSRRVSLTPAGERFVERAQAVLAELEELRARSPPRRRDQRPARYGWASWGSGSATAGRRCADAVGVQQRDLTLEYRDLDLVDQYDALRRGDVDVAIVQYVGDLDGLDLEPVLCLPAGCGAAGVVRAQLRRRT